ncbi:hypothetical protein M011DRAFT_470797 [Sporormia fimetaria CBS 119925]|uniref:Retrovirus-related Pol polyprotein from transposon TNT 1-94-like beta-barrel domain-containing protein n=1 Tax=Sporormia fimetaria CBS 119925 TaxID=1340428 RepID=A0A6A6V0T1_9PLEO|nr:hypothetical protein M011DRAFT_470797 [Sporormia fimetaria CBS 119925]
MVSTTPSESKPLSSDWIWSNVSNVHMCNDRRWFTEYTPFKSRAGNIYTDEENVEVAGVGTVILPVKRSPTRSGPKAHGKIVLHNVIYCPSALCNIFAFSGGCSPGEDYVIRCGGADPAKSKGSITKEDKTPVAYFDPKATLFNIRLSGPPYGPVTGDSVLDDNRPLLVNVRWPESEKARFAQYLRESGNQTTATKENVASAEATSISAPYTEAEKSWLKDQFKSEYHFLKQLGLTIYKDEDREECKNVLRMLMKQNNNDEEDEDEEESDSDDFEGHMADHHFDPKTLDWINKHYGNSINFMISHGLKFYNADDCEEAKHIASVMMEDD